MIQDAPKHSLQFGLLTAVCGVGAIVCTFATIRISQTVPYWTVVPSVLLLVSMRRDSDLVTSWGMIAMAMLVASVDFSWRLPGCFQFSGFLHRYELQTRIGELYLTHIFFDTVFARDSRNHPDGLARLARANQFFKLGNIVARLSQPRSAKFSARRAELL